MERDDDHGRDSADATGAGGRDADSHEHPGPNNSWQGDTGRRASCITHRHPAHDGDAPSHAHPDECLGPRLAAEGGAGSRLGRGGLR